MDNNHRRRLLHAVLRHAHFRQRRDQQDQGSDTEHDNRRGTALLASEKSAELLRDRERRHGALRRNVHQRIPIRVYERARRRNARRAGGARREHGGVCRRGFVSAEHLRARADSELRLRRGIAGGAGASGRRVLRSQSASGGRDVYVRRVLRGSRGKPRALHRPVGEYRRRHTPRGARKIRYESLRAVHGGQHGGGGERAERPRRPRGLRYLQGAV